MVINASRIAMAGATISLFVIPVFRHQQPRAEPNHVMRNRPLQSAWGRIGAEDTKALLWVCAMEIPGNFFMTAGAQVRQAGSLEEASRWYY
jgi:hypothetical protein